MSFEQIRVVIAGHTGLNKIRCVEERLVPHLLSQDAEWQAASAEGNDEECSRIRNEQILVLELERAIPSTAYKIIGTPPGRTSWMASFLDMKRAWRTKASNPKYVFLLAHLSFQSDSHFYTPVTWTHTTDDGATSFAFLQFLLEDFQPTFVVTLIDDVYSVQARLNPRRHFRLSELMRWRNIEALFADYVMDAIEIRLRLTKSTLFPHLRSPIFSVRQSVNSLVAYIANPKVPRVYLSYPISKPLARWREGNSDLINQINHFRSFFGTEVAAFDPITINERPIQIAIDELRSAELANEKQRIASLRELMGELSGALDRSDCADARSLLASIEDLAKSNISEEDDEIVLDKMWPVGDHATIAPITPNTQVSIKRSEVDEVITANRARSEVDHQIRIRDLRLIDQSDCIVVYRPGLSKEDWSTGTLMECSHAKETGKGIIILKEGDDADPQGPFDHKSPSDDIITIEDPSEESARLEGFQKALARVSHYSGELLQRRLR